MNKPELLSPAGNMEKLKAAVAYGADAVYFGGEAFGLRAFAGNFTLAEMKEAMEFLHAHGKRGYLTVNSYARDYELDALKEYMINAAKTGVDAFIISDPGVFQLAKECAPNVERHISTQANSTNSAAIKFWQSMGASRVIMARELPKAELAVIANVAQIEVECFVHGAICISYSGRCIISAYMAGRDANRGECTQPCRWKYTIKEETRPNQEFPIEEDENGTYLYNAKDLCLIDRIGEMAAMGISSMKIEGRMKSVMYAAIATGVYRKAIDAAYDLGDAYEATPEWRALLESISNRNYTEGFYAGTADRDSMNYETSAYVRNSDFLGVIREQLPLQTGQTNNNVEIAIDCRGKFSLGEVLEIITTNMERLSIIVSKIIDKRNIEQESTKPSERYIISGVLDNSDVAISEWSILRRALI